MTLYREPLPEDCPPETAEEIDGRRIVFRLVDSDPPTDADFDSWRAKNLTERPRTASECHARGVSVYSRPRDVRKLIELNGAKEARVCQVALDRGAGRIQKIGGRSHYTWWPLADFDILSHCQVVR